MALLVKHPYTANGIELGTGEVGKDEWNAGHTMTGTPNKLLGFDGSGNPADYNPNAVTGGFTVGGTLVLSNDYTEKYTSLGQSNTFTVSLTNGTTQVLATNGNTQIELPSPVAGKSYVLIIQYTGTHTLTWTGGGVLKWAGGSTPVTSSTNGKFDLFSFICGSSNTFAQMIGKGY